ncbi:HIT family protein, partial [uncultured Arcanobacterium sp.]|uniref:HIT family protein n=1 Tax=uncultured Arcanobacterium sp. TaxID=487520 RepID=UPI0026363BD8
MSVFQKIICGKFPGRFVWEDDICVAFATIEPVTPGHVLVVPRQAIDKYSDVAPEDFAHLAKVAQIIGRA